MVFEIVEMVVETVRWYGNEFDVGVLELYGEVIEALVEIFHSVVVMI